MNIVSQMIKVDDYEMFKPNLKLMIYGQRCQMKGNVLGVFLVN